VVRAGPERSAAKAITSGPNGCATADNGATPTRYLSPSTPRATDFDKVCGIPGFRLGKMTGPEGRHVQEQIAGSLKEGLFCNLSFKGYTAPFVIMAIVDDPVFVGSLKNRTFDRANCDGKETVFAFDLPEEEKKEVMAGLPDETGLGKAFSRAARKALHCG
jgi:hypothetical protein